MRCLLSDFASCCYFHLSGSQSCFQQIPLKLLLNSTCSWRWLGFQREAALQGALGGAVHSTWGKPADNEPSFLFKYYMHFQSPHRNYMSALKTWAWVHKMSCAICVVSTAPWCPFQTSITSTSCRAGRRVVGLYNALKLWLIFPLHVHSAPTMSPAGAGRGINSCKCSLKAPGPMLEPA